MINNQELNNNNNEDNSFEMLEYLEIENEGVDFYRNFYRSSRHNDFERKKRKIDKKTYYAVLRLFFLFLFFYLDNFQMTDFILNIVNFLLIHEAFVISNYLILSGYILYRTLFSLTVSNADRRGIALNMPFPTVCHYLNSLNNM